MDKAPEEGKIESTKELQLHENLLVEEVLDKWHGNNRLKLFTKL